jgi:integrase
MGQLRKRGTFYQIRYYRAGQRIEESTGFTKYDEARELLKQREGDISKGVPISATSTRLTFDDAVADVVNDYKTNGQRSTPELERRIRLHLTPVFGGRRLSMLTTSDLRAFVALRLTAKASPAEINRELAIVRRAFKLAIKAERYHGRVPSFPMLAEDNVRTGFFDREMLSAVLAKLPAPEQAVVTFAYLVGWRVQSEILPLEWRQVDRKACTVRLDAGRTKNKRGRVVNFSDNAELRDLFGTLWREHDALQARGTLSPFVFHRSGRRIKTFRKTWATACEAAGYPGRILHDLRRSAVRNLVRSGVPDTVAMKITGHRTRSVFDRYDISSEADVRLGLGRLEGASGTNRGDNRLAASADANTKHQIS